MFLSKNIPIIQTLNTEQLYGIVVNEEILNEVISDNKFPCIKYIYFINQLIINDNFKDIEKYKNILYENKNLFPGFKPNKEVLYNKENCVLSYFSCINLIERILKYGKFKNNSIEEIDDSFIARIVLLNIIETSVDEKQDSDDYNDELLELYLSIITYNQFSNNIDNSNFFRIGYLYENYIINNKPLLDNFKKFYGFTLKNYLLFLKFYLFLGEYKNLFINKNILKNNNIDSEEIDKCIKDACFDYKSQKNKDKIVINSYIPSHILIEKPIIDFYNKYYVLNPRLLLNRIYNIFFNKIEKSWGNEKDYKRKFYGPLFERYCKDIAKLYCNKSKFKYYEFIEEFSYTLNNNKQNSSDFYIVYNDVAIIFEIKSTSRYKETTIDINIYDKEKFVKEEINYKIFSPIKQIEERLKEIKKLNPDNYKDIPLRKIQFAKNYFYIVVSEETIINNYNIYNNYISKINSIYTKNTPIYLNITEFEYLLMSLYKRKKPIDVVLKHYISNYACDNFYSMILKEKKDFKFTRLDIFNNISFNEQIKKVLK